MKYPKEIIIAVREVKKLRPNLSNTAISYTIFCVFNINIHEDIIEEILNGDDNAL